jgi:hypothetical protein
MDPPTSRLESTNQLGAVAPNLSFSHACGVRSCGEGVALACGQSPSHRQRRWWSIRFPAAFAVWRAEADASSLEQHRFPDPDGGQELVRPQVGPMARSAADLALILGGLDTPLHAAHDGEVPPVSSAPSRGIGGKAFASATFETMFF